MQIQPRRGVARRGRGRNGRPTEYDGVEVLQRGLRLFLLLAVLLQYTPMRVCAIERVAIGSSCHEWDADAAFASSHAEEQRCGSPTDSEHECICEQPKVDGQHNPQAIKCPLDWANLSLAAVVPVAASTTPIPSLPDPDPDRGAPVALQFPLLI